MIYSVVPEELPELYEQLAAYYKDDPNVKVIVDRRAGVDRRHGAEAPEGEQRTVRDRRRSPLTGSAPADAPGQ